MRHDLRLRHASRFTTAAPSLPVWIAEAKSCLGRTSPRGGLNASGVDQHKDAAYAILVEPRGVNAPTKEERMVLATGKAEDFERFWSIFSTKGADKRKQYGSKSAHVFRDPNEPD